MYTPVLVKIKKHHGPQNSVGNDASPSTERLIYHFYKKLVIQLHNTHNIQLALKYLTSPLLTTIILLYPNMRLL